MEECGSRLSKTFLKNELVRYTIRKALDLPVDDISLRNIVGSTSYPIMRRVVNHVASRLVILKNNHIRCGICGKGPFTKRGLYLHMIRIHVNDILKMIDDALEEKRE